MCDSLDIFRDQGFPCLRDTDLPIQSFAASVMLYLCLIGWGCCLGGSVGLSTACPDPSFVCFDVLWTGRKKSFSPKDKHCVC